MRSPLLSRTHLLLQGGAALGSAALVAGLANYATNLVLARRLDTAAFGDASVVVTLMLALTCVAGGLQLAAAADTGAAHAERSRRRGRRTGLALAGALVPAAPVLSSLLSTESTFLFVLLAAAVPAQMTLAAERGLLQGRLRFVSVAVSYLAEGLVRFVATVAIVLVYPGAEAAAVGLAITFTATHRLTRHAVGSSPEPRDVVEDAPRPLVAPTLFTAALLVLGHGDLLLVKQAFAPEEAGSYALVALIGRLVLFAGAALAAVVFPTVIRDATGARRMVRVAAGAAAGIGALVAVMFGLGGPALFATLFASDAPPSTSVIWVHLAGTTLIAVIHVLAVADLASGSSRAATRLALLAAGGLSIATVAAGATSARIAEFRLIGAILLLVALWMRPTDGTRRPRRVLLLGTHGQANVGDELLLQTFLTQLGAEHEYTINSYDPAATDATIAPDVRRDVFDTASTRLGLIRRIHHTDVVVVAGGSIVKELNAATGRHRHSTLLMVLAIVTYAHVAARTPMLMANIGVGPLPSRSGRVVAGLILRQVDLVAAHDAGSAALCVAVGVHSDRLRTVPDAVFANHREAWTTGVQTARVAGRPLRVGLNLNHDPEDEDLWDEFLSRLTTALRGIASRVPLEVVGLPMQSSFKPDHDRAVLEAFLADVDLPHVVASVVDHLDAAAVLESVDVVVAERLHTLVLASIVGTPAVALPYSVKVTELVGQLGLQERSFGIRDRFVPEALAAAIEGAARDGATEGTRLQMVADRHRSELEPYFAAVRDWIVYPTRVWPAATVIARR